MSDLFGNFAPWIIEAIYAFGYIGVAVLIVAQNLFPLIPSALILPLAGFLVGQGRFSFALVLLAATTGSVVGAMAVYTPARWLGEEPLRRFIRRFGRYAFVRESDLDRASGVFDRHGGKAILISRLIPGVGTLISLPAGIRRMPLWRFVSATAVGTTMWNGAFIGLGWALGAQWRHAREYAHILEYMVVAVVVVGIFYFLWRRVKARK